MKILLCKFLSYFNCLFIFFKPIQKQTNLKNWIFINFKITQSIANKI